MKIAYCIAATHRSGGMERVLSNKLRELSKLDYQLFVITTDQKQKSSYFDLPPFVQQFDLNVNYENTNGKGLLTKIFFYPVKLVFHYIRLRRLLAKLKPDITVSMFDQDALILHRIDDGSKKILEVHFSRHKHLQYSRNGVWRLIDLLRNYADKKIAARFDRFIVLTEEDRELWCGLSNMQVIANACELKPGEMAALQSRQVLAVGRLEMQKGYDQLVRAWSLLQPEYSHWHLAIYGNGSLKAKLLNQIEASGLTNSIRLFEPVTRIEQVYTDSSMLVMSSNYEGLPMALLEAQACGLPLVSFACQCGPKDIIKDGVNGFLVEPGDTLELAQKLKRLMKSRQLRLKMGKNSLDMRERFRNKVIMEKWVTLFNSIVEMPIK